MTNYRSLAIRILQVIWVLGLIGLVMIGIFATFAAIDGNGVFFGLLIAIAATGGCLLAFMVIMLSIQYIFLASLSIRDLFDGSLIYK